MATFLLVLRVLFGIFNIIPPNGKYSVQLYIVLGLYCDILNVFLSHTLDTQSKCILSALSV